MLGLDNTSDAIVAAESKRKQYVRDSAELYASHGCVVGEEEEGEEEEEDEG